MVLTPGSDVVETRSYESINYSDGVRLSKESITKITQDFELFKKTLQLKELESQKKIEESKALESLINKSKQEQEEKETQRQLNLKQHFEKIQEEKKVQEECMGLIENAQKLVDEKNYEEAMQLYNIISERYKEIDYHDGIRAIGDSLSSLDREYQIYKDNLEYQQRKIQEEIDNKKRIDELILTSQAEEERKEQERQARLQQEEGRFYLGKECDSGIQVVQWES